MPGVKAAGTIQFLPLSGHDLRNRLLARGTDGRAIRPRALPTDCSLVSRGYFAAMGIPVLDGRPFDRRDRIEQPSRPGGQPVVRQAVLS